MIPYNDKSSYSMNTDKFTILLEVPNLTAQEYDLIRAQLLNVLVDCDKSGE